MSCSSTADICRRRRPAWGRQTVLESVLQKMVARLGATFASPEAYRAYWHAEPIFEPRDWSPWLDEYIDYDLGADGRPKSHEPAVRFDFFDLARSDLVTDRLRRLRAPVTMIRAEHGFSRAHPMVIPDAVVRSILAAAPHARDVLIAGTTHYTIALAEPGASRVAELLLQIS